MRTRTFIHHTESAFCVPTMSLIKFQGTCTKSHALHIPGDSLAAWLVTGWCVQCLLSLCPCSEKIHCTRRNIYNRFVNAQPAAAAEAA